MEFDIATFNKKSNIAICTLWTKKEVIIDLLKQEGLVDKVNIVGTLYTSSGVNHLIKTIAQLPINTLVVCGENLSGSLEFLLKVFNGDNEAVERLKIEEKQSVKKLYDLINIEKIGDKVTIHTPALRTWQLKYNHEDDEKVTSIIKKSSFVIRSDYPNDDETDLSNHFDIYKSMYYGSLILTKHNLWTEELIPPELYKWARTNIDFHSIKDFILHFLKHPDDMTKIRYTCRDTIKQYYNGKKSLNALINRWQQLTIT